MNEKSYINCSGRKVLQYFQPDSLMLDLPFILTQSKLLTRKMPYMLLEKKVVGEYIAAIRLVDFHEKEGIISLNVQELTNSKTYTLSWNMEYNGDWWLWSLADFETLHVNALRNQ